MWKVSDKGVNRATVAGGDGIANETVCVTSYLGVASGTTLKGLGNGPVCEPYTLTDACWVTDSTAKGYALITDRRKVNGCAPPRIRGAGPDVVAS